LYAVLPHLPALRAPTLSPLDGNCGFAVRIAGVCVCRERQRERERERERERNTTNAKLSCTLSNPVKKSELPVLLPKLKQLGGCDIVVSAINQMVI